MWCFLFTLTSVDRIPATEVGLFSRVRMPWRMEKDAFFFDVHVVLFEAIQKLQDPWIGLRENLQETPMIFMIHGKINGFPLRCSLKAKPMDGLPDLLI